jgi:hypothetical protein
MFTEPIPPDTVGTSSKNTPVLTALLEFMSRVLKPGEEERPALK